MHVCFSVSLDDFKDVCADLCNDLFKCEDDEAEELCCTHDFNTDNCSFSKLNQCITVDCGSLLDKVKKLLSQQLLI